MNEIRNELLAQAVVKHLGPSALAGGQLSPLEIFELGFNAGIDASSVPRPEPVVLDHIACIDDGVLRYMSGRKAPGYDCELYAMADGCRAPTLYAAPASAEPVNATCWTLDVDAVKFLVDTLTAGDEPEEFTLRVGYIREDDGTVKHGLMVECTEYPEEGAVLLVESAATQDSLNTKRLLSALEHANSEIVRIEETVRELKEKTFAHFHDQECWIYQGDGCDHLESLVCPVVIQPKKLMEIIAERGEAVGEIVIADHQTAEALAGQEPFRRALKELKPEAFTIGTKLYTGPQVPEGWMPLLGTGLGVSFKVLDETQAKKNHGQTLARLADRGGLSPSEALAVAERREYKSREIGPAIVALSALAAAPQIGVKP